MARSRAQRQKREKNSVFNVLNSHQSRQRDARIKQQAFELKQFDQQQSVERKTIFSRRAPVSHEGSNSMAAFLLLMSSASFAMGYGLQSDDDAREQAASDHVDDYASTTLATKPRFEYQSSAQISMIDDSISGSISEGFTLAKPVLLSSPKEKSNKNNRKNSKKVKSNHRLKITDDIIPPEKSDKLLDGLIKELELARKRGEDPKEYAESSYYIASAIGHDETIELTRYLVERVGVQLDKRMRLGYTALHGAAISGSLKNVKYLIDKPGLNLHARWDGKTLMCLAAKAGQLHIISFLVEDLYLDVNEESADGLTAFDNAVIKKDLVLAKYLISIGARVGNRALFLSAENDDDEMMRFLLQDAHANPYHLNQDEALYDFCKRKNKLRCLNHLEKSHNAISVKITDADAFGKMIKRNNLEAVNKFINKFGSDFINKYSMLREAIKLNSLTMTQYFVLDLHCDVMAVDKNKSTYLHIAIQEQSKFEILEFLVWNTDIDVDAKNQDGKTALDLAKELSNKEAEKFLQEVTHLRSVQRRLILSIHQNNLKELKEIIQNEKINVHYPIYSQYNKLKPGLLHIAASFNRVDIIKYIVEVLNINVMQGDAKGRVAFDMAVQARHVKCVEYFVQDTWVLTSAPDKDGKSALSYAKKNKYTEIVDILKNEKSRTDVALPDPALPLHSTEQYKQNLINLKKILDQLEEREKADYSASTVLKMRKHAEDNDLIKLSASHDDGEELTQYFLKNLGVDQYRYCQGFLPFHWAIMSGSLKNVFRLATPRSLSMRSAQGDTALGLAVRSGKINSVHALLKLPNIDVNEESGTEEYTPLQLAVMRNDISIIYTLLEAGKADVLYAFFAAIDNDNISILMLLEKYGADFNLKLDGLNALQYAKEHRKNRCYHYLNSKKADPYKNAVVLQMEGILKRSRDALEKEKIISQAPSFPWNIVSKPTLAIITGIMFAYRKLSYPGLFYFLEASYKFLRWCLKKLFQSSKKAQPIQLLSKTLHEAAVDEVDFEKYLKDADVDSYDKLGFTPVHYAARAGMLRILELLVEKNADIKLLTKKGQNILHIAAGYGRVNIVNFLISRNFDVNYKDNQGYTALHWAAKNNHLEVVIKLLETDIDIHTVNQNGESALSLAKNQDIKSLLRPQEENILSLDAKLIHEKKQNTFDVKQSTALSPLDVWLRDIDLCEFFSCKLDCSGDKREIHLSLKKSLLSSNDTHAAYVYLIEFLHTEVSKKEKSCSINDFCLKGQEIIFSSDYYKHIKIVKLDRWFQDVQRDPSIAHSAVVRMRKIMQAADAEFQQAFKKQPKIVATVLSDKSQPSSERKSVASLVSDKKTTTTSISAALDQQNENKKSKKLDIVFHARGDFKQAEPGFVQKQLIEDKKREEENVSNKKLGSREAEKLTQVFDYHHACIINIFSFLDADLEKDGMALDRDQVNLIKHFCLSYHLMNFFVKLKGSHLSDKPETGSENKEQSSVLEKMRTAVAHHMIDLAGDRKIIEECVADLLNKKLNPQCLQEFSLAYKERLKKFTADPSKNEEPLFVKNTKIYDYLDREVDKKMENKISIKEAKAKINLFVRYINAVMAQVFKEDGWSAKAAENIDAFILKHSARLDAAEFLLMCIGEIGRYALTDKQVSLIKAAKSTQKKIQLEQDDKFASFIGKCIILRNKFAHDNKIDRTEMLGLAYFAKNAVHKESHLRLTPFESTQSVRRSVVSFLQSSSPAGDSTGDDSAYAPTKSIF